MLGVLLLALQLPKSSKLWPVVLETPQGDVRGEEFFHFSTKIRSFLGVPFAEPPIEERRFRVADYKRKWDGVWNATELSPACAQAPDDYNVSFWGSEMWNANTRISEDCLYLNVWAPADAHNATVMVWFFGGGFYSGSPSLDLYDGKTLASLGNVIVVNINYRLGVFGFLYLDHPDAPGNVGLLDQQLALRWVHDNIAYYGGNPNKVCVFGQSAGAASIVAHLIAPGSRGLFSNAIVQSGALDNAWAMDSPARAIDKSLQMIDLVGCRKTKLSLSLACMRMIPFELLVANFWKIRLAYMEFPFVIVSRDKNFFQMEDGFISLRERRFHRKVNLMIGMNKDEAAIWNIYNLGMYFDRDSRPELNKEEYEDAIDKAFAVQPHIVRSATKFVYSDVNCTHRGGRRSFQLADHVNQAIGDYFFSCDSLWFADQIASMPKSNVFVYHFAQSSSQNLWPKWTGAPHGYELQYIFGQPLHYPEYRRREAIFSRKMMEFWISFAKFGFPKVSMPKRTETWPLYKPGNYSKWMMLKSGSNTRVIPQQKQDVCHFWRLVKDAEYTAYLTQVYGPTKAACPSCFRVVSWFLIMCVFGFRL